MSKKVSVFTSSLQFQVIIKGEIKDSKVICIIVLTLSTLTQLPNCL